MKKKYDLVIPLGNACSCSQTLRGAGLQLLSFPFDWVGPGSVDTEVPLDLGKRVRAICDGIDSWLKAEDFELFADSGEQATTEFYRNNMLKFVFLHDFPKNVPFEIAYPEVRAKYLRRFNRLHQLLENARRVLIFRLDRPDAAVQTPVTACREALQLLSARFPGTVFELILMQQDKNIPFARRKVTEVEPGLTLIRFDYRSTAPTALPSNVNLKQTEAALRSICRVQDYRTADERRANRKAKLKKLFAKLSRSVTKRLGRTPRGDH